MRFLSVALALLVALALAACGSDDEETTTAEAALLEPAAVEESVQAGLDEDEFAGQRSSQVDCGEEGSDAELACKLTGDGFTGTAVATPAEGFSYTGELEGPDGPTATGGGTSEGSIDDPASIERALNETLEDERGAEAECPDEPADGALECTVSGGGYSGTLTVTPNEGFQWEAEIETPEGPRVILGDGPE